MFLVTKEGAIVGFAKAIGLWDQKENTKPSQHQLLINIRNELFIKDLTQDVLNLTKSYRSREDPEYADILERLQIGTSTETDAERLM